jgi:hypothetical protein
MGHTLRRKGRVLSRRPRVEVLEDRYVPSALGLLPVSVPLTTSPAPTLLVPTLAPADTTPPGAAAPAASVSVAVSLASPFPATAPAIPAVLNTASVTLHGAAVVNGPAGVNPGLALGHGKQDGSAVSVSVGGTPRWPSSAAATAQAAVDANPGNDHNALLKAAGAADVHAQGTGVDVGAGQSVGSSSTLPSSGGSGDLPNAGGGVQVNVGSLIDVSAGTQTGTSGGGSPGTTGGGSDNGGLVGGLLNVGGVVQVNGGGVIDVGLGVQASSGANITIADTASAPTNLGSSANHASDSPGITEAPSTASNPAHNLLAAGLPTQTGPAGLPGNPVPVQAAGPAVLTVGAGETGPSFNVLAGQVGVLAGDVPAWGAAVQESGTQDNLQGIWWLGEELPDQGRAVSAVSLAVDEDLAVSVQLPEQPPNQQRVAPAAEGAGLLTDASPFDLATLETAMQSALDQLTELGQLLQSGRLGAWPWVCLGVAVTAAACDLLRRKHEQLLFLIAASAGELSPSWLPEEE